MGAIRDLYTRLRLDARQAVNGLVAYDRLWQQTAKNVEAAAARVQAATARLGGAGLGGGAGGGGRGSGGAGGRRGGGKDPLDAAIAAATRQARAGNQAQARGEGLAAGAKGITAAASALGSFASKSDRAKAAISDLTAQVERNRREMADLRVQVVKTGDADGTLKARMEGLGAATGRAQIELGKARRELRAIDGGLIDAVRSAGSFTGALTSMRVAAGNLISAGISRGIHAIADGVVGATKAAIDFESSFADVKKVLPDTMSVKQIDDLEAGLLRLGPAVGVLPTDMAKLTASLAQSGIASDQLLTIAEDASKVSVAFGITGAEAGHAFASIQAALGTTKTETNSLFDTINQLSNNMNVTAPQLLDLEQRVGSVGRAMSLSGETTAALGAALVATGASSEVAATGVRTFLARLGAGAAATPKQLKAFETLGLSAKEVAKNLSSGDMGRAEGQIKEVVAAIQNLRDEDRLPTLIEMFGSESIGTIGALATNVELLGTAFSIAGDKEKAAGSVLKEYAARSATTEHQLAKLKAGVQVLAIQFGDALLPTITEVAEYLNTPEGQEWGRQQVEGLIGAVKGAIQTFQEAWPIIKAVGGAIASFVDIVGGGTVAVGLLGAALLSVGGPFVATAAVATATGAAIGNALLDSKESLYAFHEQAQSNLADVAKSLADGRGKFGELTDVLVQMADRTDKSGRAWAAWQLQMLGATDALELFYAKERENLIRNGKMTEDAARRASVEADKVAYAQRTRAASEADRAARFDRADGRLAGGGRDSSGDEARYAALSARRARGEKLRPSEALEYKRLSKRLDEAMVGKAPAGHKATKMDKQLAAMDPAVRDLVRRGGEEDAGGDSKVAANALDRAVYDRAAKAHGGTGIGGGASVGPGPSTTTYNVFNNPTVNIDVDAKSNQSAADNLRSASTDVAASVTRVVITGGASVVAQRNAGGVMRGPV